MEKLGIEPSLLLAQIINFGIIVVVLTKLLYKPILGMIEKRKKEIEEGIAIAQRQRAEEEELTKRREKLLSEARREALTILEDAKKQGKDAERDIVASAQRQATEIIEKAKHDAAGVHEALAGDIRREAIELAAAMTKRLVAGALSSGDQHKLIAKHLADLAKSKVL